MIALFILSLLLSMINGRRLVEMAANESSSTASTAGVCIKMWSITDHQWIFLGEGSQLNSECSTKWSINPEFSLCAHPGTCISMKSMKSGSYLSSTPGQLSSGLTVKEIWKLSATRSDSGPRAILIENNFIESQHFNKPYILCFDEELIFKDDEFETNPFCHWIIEEIVNEPPPTQRPSYSEEPELPCSTDHRHRKAWHLLTDSERRLYISAVHELNKNGKGWTLTAVHAGFDANVQAHGCASFASYHRYHLWEFENAVRNLGGKYKCFTLPYWDITNEVLFSRNPYNWHILHSGLGHNGDINDEWCIDDDIFGKYGDYKPYLHCAVNEQLEPLSIYDYDRPQCCLKRNVCDITNPQTECIMYTPSEIMEMVTDFDKFGSDEHQLTASPAFPPSQPNLRPSPPPTAGFMYELEHKHGNFHGIIGGSGVGHLANLHFSPDDPVFWIMHNFVDMIYALWQDCHDYDLVKEEDITTDIYNGVLAEPDGVRQLHGPSRIDDELILTELMETNWSYVSVNNLTLTPRDLHNISRWNYSFDKGSFFDNANVDEFCRNINEKWFYLDSLTNDQ